MGKSVQEESCDFSVVINHVRGLFNLAFQYLPRHSVRPCGILTQYCTSLPSPCLISKQKAFFCTVHKQLLLYQKLALQSMPWQYLLPISDIAWDIFQRSPHSGGKNSSSNLTILLCTLVHQLFKGWCHVGLYCCTKSDTDMAVYLPSRISLFLFLQSKQINHLRLPLPFLGGLPKPQQNSKKMKLKGSCCSAFASIKPCLNWRI